MPRPLTAYVCQQCESQYPQSYGRCPGCGSWNSLEETHLSESASPTATRTSSYDRTRVAPLTAVQAQQEERVRLSSPQLDHVFSGGIVPGSTVLLSGDPGVGKSTLLLQVAADISNAGIPVLYVTGEESPEQLRLRAHRLGPVSDKLLVMAESNVDSIVAAGIDTGPRLVVVDSIQTMRVDDLQSTAGSVAQVKESASRLVRFGKETHTAIVLIGHVTKEGSIAGPKVLEHLVDVVLYLEGEHFEAYRILRSLKNRFGSSHEIAVFDMRDDGMHEVPSLSGLFISNHGGVTSGSALTVSMEGTRPIPLEIQALSTRTAFGLPRRASTGIDLNRLHMLTAVLAKRGGMDAGSQDIYVNVVGGLRVDEPAVDLATVLAIYSSYHDVDLPRAIVIGEIGLGGEIRPVTQTLRRLREAASLGVTQAIIPSSTDTDTTELGDLAIARVDTVADALRHVRP